MRRFTFLIAAVLCSIAAMSQSDTSRSTKIYLTDGSVDNISLDEIDSIVFTEEAYNYTDSLQALQRDTMNVYLTDGTIMRYSLDDVDSIVYYNSTGYINGYAYVDLGLSVKWATCNIGASSPESTGNRFAWGETSTKSYYMKGNSKTYEVSMSDRKDISGDSTYDAATANWGSPWRMPTKDEMQELAKNCTWEWTTYNGTQGCLVTGPNGNSIFLPKSGYSYATTVNSVTQSKGSDGYYWSSTSNGGTYSSYYLYFGKTGAHNASNTIWRYYGIRIRPVSD